MFNYIIFFYFISFQKFYHNLKDLEEYSNVISDSFKLFSKRMVYIYSHPQNKNLKNLLYNFDFN